jgi:hypothetical protein
VSETENHARKPLPPDNVRGHVVLPKEPAPPTTTAPPPPPPPPPGKED